MKVLLALIVVLSTLSVSGCKNANHDDADMSGSSMAMCSSCNGTGMNGADKCALCGGTGRK